MVSHNAFPGFGVTICGGNGEPLQEYDNARYRPSREESRSTVAAKYIISEAGQSFSIKLSLKPELEMRTEGIWVDISIDGTPIQGRFFRKSIFEERGRKLQSTVRGVEISRGEEAVLRPFIFTNLVTTDEISEDTQSLINKEDLAKSGIVIRVFKAAVPSHNAEVFNDYFRDDDEPKDKVINEVLVKGQDTLHTIGYGKAEKAPPLPTVALRKVGMYPIMIFKFLYSSEERLRLIRQLSSPTPEEAKEEIKPEPLEFDQEASLSVPPDPQRAPIDLDSMSPLQQMQLLKDLKDKLNIGRKLVTPPISPSARRAGVKKAVGKVPGKKVAVKKEPHPASNSPLRIVRDNGIDMIDLTEED